MAGKIKLTDQFFLGHTIVEVCHPPRTIRLVRDDGATLTITTISHGDTFEIRGCNLYFMLGAATDQPGGPEVMGEQVAAPCSCGRNACKNG